MQVQNALQPGTLVDNRYRIERFIAAGGMGAIYQATQQPLGRVVALKVMRHELAQDQTLAKRFAREAQTVSQLSHPHTITLFDYGISPEGLMYLSMEWLDGLDLSDAIQRQGALDPVRAARITVQICSALAEAHKKGIIHRDLKPENVFLTHQEGQPDFVKVLDFGIAKISHANAQTQITRIGMVCGTPEFMSPEQGRGEELDGRSDVYAVGTLLYAMLEGRPPFVAENPLTVVMNHQMTPFPPLSSHIPSALQEIVSRATDKDVKGRYRSADEMGAALEGYLNRVDPTTGSFNQPELNTSLGTPKQQAAPTAPGQQVFVPAARASTTIAPAQQSGKLKMVLAGLIVVLVAVAATVVVVILNKGETESTQKEETKTENSKAPEVNTNPCADGRMIGPETQNHCCWEGQKWSEADAKCVGEPRACPPQTRREVESCVPLEAELQALLGQCNEGGDMDACLEASGWLGTFPREIKRADELVDKVIAHYQRGCSAEKTERCVKLADAYLSSSTPEKSLEVLKDACNRSHPESCYELTNPGLYLFELPPPPGALKVYGEKACALKQSLCPDRSPQYGIQFDEEGFPGDDFLPEGDLFPGDDYDPSEGMIEPFDEEALQKTIDEEIEKSLDHVPSSYGVFD